LQHRRASRGPRDPRVRLPGTGGIGRRSCRLRGSRRRSAYLFPQNPRARSGAGRVGRPTRPRRCTAVRKNESSTSPPLMLYYSSSVGVVRHDKNGVLYCQERYVHPAGDVNRPRPNKPARCTPVRGTRERTMSDPVVETSAGTGARRHLAAGSTRSRGFRMERRRREPRDSCLRRRPSRGRKYATQRATARRAAPAVRRRRRRRAGATAAARSSPSTAYRCVRRCKVRNCLVLKRVDARARRPTTRGHGSDPWRRLRDGVRLVGMARRDETLPVGGDVVVVTVNHRLGALGYLHLAEIGGDNYRHSGVVGMLDLVAALEWVRDKRRGLRW